MLRVEASAFKTTLERRGEMRAVQLEGPCVIRAAEELSGIAAAVGHQLRTPMRAAVVQHIDRLVRRAHHDHVLIADARRMKVAPIGHLAVMADVNPRMPVNPLHLQLEDFRVGIDRFVYAVVAYQRGDLLVGIRHGLFFLQCGQSVLFRVVRLY